MENNDFEIVQEVIKPLPAMFESEQGFTEANSTILPDAGSINIPTVRVHFPDEGGTWSYKQGCKYPDKQWVFREAVWANDIIKRALINIAHLLLETPLKYFLAPMVILPRSVQRRTFRKALQLFAEWGEYTNLKWNAYFKPIFYCDMGREIRRVGIEMAGPIAWKQYLVRIIVNFFEHDDAYRYRAQDGICEIDLDAMMQNPSKECLRVLRIMKSRDRTGVVPKFDMALKLLPYVFQITGIGETLKEFFSKVDMDKLYPDEADNYKMLIWGGYAFGGVPDEERASMRVMIDMEWKLAISRAREVDSFARDDKYRQGILFTPKAVRNKMLSPSIKGRKKKSHSKNENKSEGRENYRHSRK